MYVNQQSNLVTEDSSSLKHGAAGSGSLEDSILTSGTTQPASDTATMKNPALGQSGTALVSTPGNYNFVIETTTDKARAVKRYRDLRSYGNKIMLQTNDSLTFRLYYSLPATPADTLRIRDSLNRWFYNSNANKVRVEP
jgi:hypothetical protein